MTTKQAQVTYTSADFRAGRMYMADYRDTVDMVGKRELDADTIASLKASGFTLVEHTLKSGKPSGLLLNPISAPVTVRRVSRVQAAGGETWENFKAKYGVETGESNRKPWYQESADNSCIVEGITENTSGKRYLRGLPKGVTVETYFIGDREATSAEVNLIRAFKKGSGGGLFVVLELCKLVNVVDETECQVTEQA